MISIKHKMKFDYPVRVVYETFRDNPEALAEKIPQLKKVEVLSREDPDEANTRIRLRFHARSPIPEVLRPVLSPGMLRWDSEQQWDNEELTNCYKVEALYFKDRVDVGGIWTFCENGGGCTIVAVEGRISIDSEGIPGLPAPVARIAGGLVEKYISRHSGPNLLRMMSALEKLLQQKYPKN